jgi:hypothetical protein
LPHTTVDIPTKFHEVWWKESKIILNPPFLFPWQLRQSLSNWFRFFWIISFECSRVTYCYATFLFHYYYYYYYSSTHFCPLYFSEMPWSNFMKPCRNIICHVKLCCIGLFFSKWLPLPWKRPKC